VSVFCVLCVGRVPCHVPSFFLLVIDDANVAIISIIIIIVVIICFCCIMRVGRRPGEKLHEVMVPGDEGYKTVDAGDRFIIFPDFRRKGVWPDGSSVRSFVDALFEI